jgi:hypothetical protein
LFNRRLIVVVLELSCVKDVSAVIDKMDTAAPERSSNVLLAELVFPRADADQCGSEPNGIYGRLDVVPARRAVPR